MNRLLALLSTAVLGAAALYAVVFVLTGAVWALTSVRAIQLLSTPFAFFALALVNAGLLAALITPRVPLRLILPLWVAQVYMALGAMPFGLLLLVHKWHILWPGLILAGVVALVALAVRRLPHVDGLRITDAFVASRPAFSPARSLGLLAAILLCVPTGLAAYGLGSAAWSLSWATGGYAALSTEGFVVRSRRFAKPGTTVILQGMMHIGEARAYEDLYASFGELDDAIVLTEGVTDTTDALGRGGVGYSRMAGRLGLEQQHAIEEDGFAVDNADVDVSRFSPQTLDMLRHSFAIWQAEDPVRAWLDYSLEYSTADPDELYRPLLADIVDLRNRSLLEHIDQAEPRHRTIVAPWGAAHMPGVSAGLVERGYTPGAWESRTLWSWSTVAEEVFR